MQTVLFEWYRTITRVDTRSSRENAAKMSQFTGETPLPYNCLLYTLINSFLPSQLNSYEFHQLILIKNQFKKIFEISVDTINTLNKTIHY